MPVVIVVPFSGSIYLLRPVEDWLLLCETKHGRCFARVLLKRSELHYDRPWVLVTYRKRW